MHRPLTKPGTRMPLQPRTQINMGLVAREMVGWGLQLVRLQQGDVLLHMVGVALTMLFHTQGVRRGVCHDVWMFALYKEG